MNLPTSLTIIDGRADLRAAEGALLGTSSWLTVDQEQVSAFAEVTDDHQWIHEDEVRAATGPFGGTVAHGFLTLSLIPPIGREIFDIRGAQMSVNYGLNRVRFPQPVRSGSRIRGRATLLEVKPIAAGDLVTIEFVIEVEGSTKPACIAETLRLVVFED